MQTVPPVSARQEQLEADVRRAVELKPPARLRTSRGRRCGEERKRKRKTLLGEKKEVCLKSI
jgi:hypothetical protein